jgi:hypothetical protein
MCTPTRVSKRVPRCFEFCWFGPSLSLQAWGAGHAAKVLEVLLRATGVNEQSADPIATAIAGIDASGKCCRPLPMSTQVLLTPRKSNLGGRTPELCATYQQIS